MGSEVNSTNPEIVVVCIFAGNNNFVCPCEPIWWVGCLSGFVKTPLGRANLGSRPGVSPRGVKAPCRWGGLLVFPPPTQDFILFPGKNQDERESFATRLNKDRLVRTVEVSQVKFGVRFLGWETPCLFLAGARSRPVGSRGSNQVTRVTQLVPLLLSGWFRTPLFVLIKPRLKSMKLHVKLVGYNLDGLWHKVARLAALQRKRERRS